MSGPAARLALTCRHTTSSSGGQQPACSRATSLVSEIKQLLTGEQADPRAAQGMFLLPVLMELVLRVLIGVGFDIYFVVASLVVAVATWVPSPSGWTG